MTNPQFTGGAIDLGALADRNDEAQGGFEPFSTVTEANVEKDIFERSMQIPVVLLIGTPRSPDSESLKAQFERLSVGQRAFLVGYLDADATPSLTRPGSWPSSFVSSSSTSEMVIRSCSPFGFSTIHSSSPVSSPSTSTTCSTRVVHGGVIQFNGL